MGGGAEPDQRVGLWGLKGGRVPHIHPHPPITTTHDIPPYMPWIWLHDIPPWHTTMELAAWRGMELAAWRAMWYDRADTMEPAPSHDGAISIMWWSQLYHMMELIPWSQLHDMMWSQLCRMMEPAPLYDGADTMEPAPSYDGASSVVWWSQLRRMMEPASSYDGASSVIWWSWQLTVTPLCLPVLAPGGLLPRQ